MKWFALALFSGFITAADVPNIDNGLNPENQTYTIEFTEDLRIGGDAAEDYLIWTGSYISVEANDQGHMFITDSGGNRILEFDPEGNFVKQIGGPGQGPGEFQNLYSFHILADQSAIAFDNLQSVTRLTTFDKDMNVLKKETIQPTPNFLQSVDFSPDGSLIGVTYISDLATGGTIHRGIMDSQFKPVLGLSAAPRVIFDQARVNDMGWWIQFLADWFKVGQRGTGIVTFAPDGQILTATSDRYEITKWTPKLEKTMVITKEYQRIPQPEEQVMALVEPIYEEVLGVLSAELKAFITPNVIRKAVVKAEFPPAKQPILAILPMEDGFFLVIHDYNPITRVSKADIFTPEGRFAGVATLPKISVNIFAGLFGSPTKLIFNGGKAYAMVPNDDMEVGMVRYGYNLKPL